MDWLKSEIDSKKRALESTAEPDGSAPKYIKRSDLEKQRLKERQEEEAKEKRDREQRLLQAAKKVAAKEDQQGKTLAVASSSNSRNGSTSPAPADSATNLVVEDSKPEAFNVSNEECIIRLRRKGQPIRLFGESDKERRLRLRALELIEERTEGQRNDFMRKMEGMEMGFNLEEMARQGASSATAANGKGKGKEATPGSAVDGPTPATDVATTKGDSDKEPNPKDEEVIVDVSLVRSNPHKVYPQIYHALKVGSLPLPALLRR